MNRTTGYPTPEVEEQSSPHRIYFILLFISVLLSVYSISAIGTYPALDPNMVLYYHFNNDSSIGENDTTIYDWSGNGNNGSVNNFNFSFNNSILNDGFLYYNGYNSHVNVSNNLNTNLTYRNFTFNVWFKTSTDQNGKRLITKRSGNYGIIIQTISDTFIQVYCGNGTSLNFYNSNDHYKLNSWNLISVSYNGTNCFSYLNGKYSGITNITNFNENNASFKIGYDGITSFFNGSIDEVIIYNKSLNNLELYNYYYNYLGICNNTLYEDCYFISNNVYNINNDIYYVNDSNFNGAINIIGDNISINFNGSTLISNSSSSTRAFYIFNSSNVYVYNLTLNKFQYGFFGNNFTDFTINNFRFNNIFASSYNNNFTNLTFKYSIYNNSRMYFFTNPQYNGLYFYKNNISNLTTYNATSLYHHGFLIGGLYGNSSRLNISSNYFFNSFPYNFFISLSGNYTNSILEHNIFSNSSYNFTNGGVMLYLNYLNNLRVYNNTFEFGSLPIYIKNSTNIDFNSNLINNIYTNGDNWNTGIVHFLSSYNNFTSNIFRNIGCLGIDIRKSNKVLLNNNVFDFNYSHSILNNANCQFDSVMAIFIGQLFKTWTGDGTENPLIDNITKMDTYSSSNIILLNNSFSGVSVLLKTQGTNNLSHDLSNFWFRSYQNPTFLINRTYLYLSNEFNYVYTIQNKTSYIPNNVFLSDDIREGYSSALGRTWISNIIYKSYSKFCHIQNSTQGVSTYKTDVFNLSTTFNVIKYPNDTYSVIFNNDTFTFNTTDNQCAYIYHNFTSLTEGDTTTFPESPITISSTSTGKIINSDLDDAINLTTIVNVYDCNTLGTITLNSIPIDSNNYTCLDNNLTFDSLQIEPNTNILLLSYDQASISNCQGFFDAGMSFTSFIVILIITAVGGFIILLFMGNEGSDIDLTMWAVVIIIGCSVMAIGMYIVSNIGGC